MCPNSIIRNEYVCECVCVAVCVLYEWQILNWPTTIAIYVTTTIMFGHFTSSHFDSASILSTHESIYPLALPSFSHPPPNAFDFYHCTSALFICSTTAELMIPIFNTNQTIQVLWLLHIHAVRKRFFNKGRAHVSVYVAIYSMN